MPAADYVPPARTRSELLSRRRQELSDGYQNTYNKWEHENPAWARRLTGPAAAAALGYGGGGDCPFPSRRDMLLERRQTQRINAMKASGFDDETQQKLTAFPLDAITTSLSRPTEDPSLRWVEEPAHKSRSALRAERRADNVRTLDAATERNVREGKLDAEQRVQHRIDMNIAYLQAAPVGQSRDELLANRRKQRASDALAAYTAYKPPQPSTFASQEEPFWKLNRAVAPKCDYTSSTEHATRSMLNTGAAKAAEHATILSPAAAEADAPPHAEAAASAAANHAANAAAAAAVPSCASASAPELLPNGSQSAEMLHARQKWWAKPDVYPAVGPREPRQEEPFKLQAGDMRYMHRKLSSGPKRSQRGYPVETRQVAEKLTLMPPPSLAHFTDAERKPFQAYTGATFKFLPSEPREVVPGQDQTSFDGYEFTQPLYSSFTADKTFQPPRLPPRPKPRQGAVALRERVRPSTTDGRAARSGPMPSTAPNGPGFGGFPEAPSAMRPGTVAMGAVRG